MRNFIFIILLFSSLSFAGFKTDYLNVTSSGTVSGQFKVDSLSTNEKIYFGYSTNTYFTYDGAQICLYVLGASQECWPAVVVASNLLLETGDALLLETGDNLLLE